MRIVGKDDPLTVGELSEMAEKMFGGLVKAVVDIKRQIMAVDADLHADQEGELISVGSTQADLWGINLYPDLFATEDFVEFDSVINIRPVMGNRSRHVEDERLRDQIIGIVGGLVVA
jgi:hypothetical protein